MVSPLEQSADSLQISWMNEQDTVQTAHALASIKNIAQAFITLQGGLGAGKTTFTRYLLQALGVSGRIKSPTYAIVESYNTADFPIWHFDFYRFNDPLEWEDAGFRDLFAMSGLKIAEWPEQAQELLPQPDLEIIIAPGQQETQRKITLRASTTLGRDILSAFHTKFSHTPIKTNI